MRIISALMSLTSSKNKKLQPLVGAVFSFFDNPQNNKFENIKKIRSLMSMLPTDINMDDIVSAISEYANKNHLPPALNQETIWLLNIIFAINLYLQEPSEEKLGQIMHTCFNVKSDIKIEPEMFEALGVEHLMSDENDVKNHKTKIRKILNALSTINSNQACQSMIFNTTDVSKEQVLSLPNDLDFDKICYFIDNKYPASDEKNQALKILDLRHAIES